ncbi:MAG: transcriptional repressor LexA [Moraxellaceae bacterium]|nr:transcriptional repressor LexA [Moraxellaceae bacterium]
MEGLTTRQAEILDFIRENIEHNGMAPTRAEVALRFGFKSKNAAADHLRALEQKGYIKLHAELSRGIQLLDAQDDDLIPIIGSVAAGLPIEAIENHDEALPVPKGLFARRPTYLLRVKGDSMKDAGILEGDLIAVYKTGIARKGQIVVARIDNEVTVKYLDSEGDKAKLVPANPAYQPLLIAQEDLIIEGVFVGLIRDSLSH